MSSECPVRNYEASLILWWAVLDRAIQDALGNANVTGGDLVAIEKEAIEWLGLFRLQIETAKEEKAPTYSARWICQHLNIYYNHMRNVVEHFKLMGYYTRRAYVGEALKDLIMQEAGKPTPMYDSTEFYIRLGDEIL